MISKMKTSLSFLVVIFSQCAPVPAHALEVKGNTIILTEAEAENCRVKGGCLLVAVETLQAEMIKVAEKTISLSLKAGLICGKNAI
jgi:hypothetical protein